MERSASEPGFLSGRGSSCSQHGSRFESKIMYKRLEQDADLLQNRINLLRQEEHKMQKKTQDTKHQIKKILDHRSTHESRSRDHENIAQIKQQELQEMREQNAKKNKQHKKILMQVGKAVMNQKKESRNLIMDEKQDLALKARVQREGEFLLKAAQHDYIRNSEIGLAQKRLKAQQDKEHEALQRAENRDCARKQALREKEDLISQMEREEIELIQRLQKAQERQKVVHAQLQDLLQPGQQVSIPPGLPRGPVHSRQSTVNDGYNIPTEVGRGSARRWENEMSRTPSCGALSRGSSCGALSRTPSRGSASLKSPVEGCGGNRARTPTGRRAPTPPDQKATYTTVDGKTIEVGPEEGLDLFDLLNN